MKLYKNKEDRFCKLLFYLIMLFSPAVLFNSCRSKSETAQQKPAVFYTCPMHPQVHEDRPGKCPICGMTLEKVVPDKKENNPTDTLLSYLVQPVDETVVGDFEVITPQKRCLHDTIKVYGTVGFDQRAENTVSSRVSGRVEKLYVKYVNQEIYKGRPLMTLYSPALLRVQRDLLQAVNNNDAKLLPSLKEELLNLGMQENEVQHIIHSRNILQNITIYSPYDGILIHPLSKNIPVREGQYVQEGQTVFTIQNVHHTWAVLDVFAKDLWKVHAGDKVELTADADPSKTIEGIINFIPPFREDNKKTALVRVYLSSGWKPGSLIRGSILVNNNETGWIVPASAVWLLGASAVVWVQNKDHPAIYQRRNVRSDASINGYIRIISGINDSDKIVKNVAYMVDRT